MCVLRSADRIIPQILALFTNVVGGVGTDGLKLFINEFGTNNQRILTEAGTGGGGAGHGVLQGTATNFVDVGVWRHLAFTVDRSQTGINVSQMYFDGVKGAQSVINTAGGMTEFPNNFANNTPAFIGSFFGTTLWFKGWMDDFRIYGKILTSDEIAHIAKQL